MQHLQMRIVVMSEEQARYEEAFEEIIENINNKRIKYYDDYEIDPPSKEKALSLLHTL